MPHRMTWHRRRSAACAALLLATVVATGQLIYWGSAPYYGYDELWHTALAAVSPPWLSLQLISADVHPPLHYLLVRPLTRVGGDPFFARLAAIIPSILSVPLWYLLLRKMRVALVPALTGTLVLAISYSFIDVGVTVRSYSLATLLLLSGLWFWLDLLPDPDRAPAARPPRWSAVPALALFSLAFWTLYAAVFVTASLFLASLLVLAGRRREPRAARHFGGWPEWLLFGLAHLLAIGWMWLGWHHHGDHSITGHINPFLPSPGQGTLDYLLSGLRSEIALFTPLAWADERYRDAALWGLLLLGVGLFQYYRRNRQTGPAVLALTPLLITGCLAAAGSWAAYPFGGLARHQYVLFPFLLMLLPIAMNAVWKPLPTAARAALAAAALLAAGLTASHSHRQPIGLGDAPPTPFWAAELDYLFGQGPGDDTLTVTPAYSSYAAFMDRWVPGIRYRNGYHCGKQGCRTAPQGFAAILEPWPDFVLFDAYADDRSQVLIARYATATVPPRPSTAFLDQLRGLLAATGRSRARVFSAVTRPVDRDPAGTTVAALAATAQRQGLKLIDYRSIGDSVIWTVERATASAATSAERP